MDDGRPCVILRVLACCVLLISRYDSDGNDECDGVRTDQQSPGSAQKSGPKTDSLVCVCVLGKVVPHFGTFIGWIVPSAIAAVPARLIVP